MTPVCDAGACTFRGRLRGGSRVTSFQFDKTIGDYSVRRSGTASCGDLSDTRVEDNEAYIIKAQETVQVSKAVRSSDGVVATEMNGTLIEREYLAPEFAAKGCAEGRVLRYEHRYVRSDPPEGKSVAVEP